MILHRFAAETAFPAENTVLHICYQYLKNRVTNRDHRVGSINFIQKLNPKFQYCNQPFPPEKKSRHFNAEIHNALKRRLSRPVKR